MLEPESLYGLSFVSEPRLSQDGHLAAFVVSTIEDEPGGDGKPPRKAYRSSIWLSRDGGEARQITSGTARDSGPAIAPDGSALAFVSTRSGPKPQAFLVPLDGGE
ncbi:MAG TPA: S9 family peptidase, partial [Deinococcales bacterium]|nr:S9 family peptidase [Deinococcales bacterium]